MARSRDKRSVPSNSTAPELKGSATSGLALDQMGAALGNLLTGGADPYAAVPAGASPEDDLPLTAGAATPESCEITPRSILEALLFVGTSNNAPLSSRQVAALMRGVRPAEIDAYVRELNLDYERRNCPYVIVEEAGGYRLALRQEFDRLRDQFFGRSRQARLSQAAIDVLAAVAYHEPVSAEEVNKLRGAESGHVLAQLVRRQLLRLERSEEKPRRPVYWTTPRFLELFGVASLAELPRSHDLDQPPAARS
jgi:segregation and condensation protein B